ncbi:hypothetical protein IV203_024204 [Nitzschia inconspicua]|uniref:Uncharacterized protein n=1 Tax=Nitzschia inconspicua TaxID=303405 RepID=A0A9K3PBF2_9STRA|nr:hypothetical protein IV203_024204 [Nitzschia inconspicua]
MHHNGIMDFQQAIAASPTTTSCDFEVSVAITCIIAWLIPRSYFTLEKQLMMGLGIFQGNREAILPATVVGAISAMGIMSILYVTSAVAISSVTHNLDRRADAIVTGMGRIVSAVLFLFVSIEIPLWLELFNDVPQNSHYHKRQVTRSTLGLRHRVCWSVLNHFFAVYFILLLYFCNASILTIIRSTSFGLICGMLIVISMRLGRKISRKRFKQRQQIVMTGSVLVSTGSALAFTFGVLFIADIWFKESAVSVSAFGLVAFFAWLGVCFLVNFFYYWSMQRQKSIQEQKAKDDNKHNIFIIDGIDASDGFSIITSDEELSDEEDTASETVELAYKSLKRSSSLMTATTKNMYSMSTEGSQTEKEDDYDSNFSLAATIESMEENSYTWCRRLKADNSKFDALVPTEPPPRSSLEKMDLCLKWTFWTAISAFHLYLLIINIGATIQQNVVRAALPGTFESLYAPGFVSGPVCAWDKANSDATIQTFDSIEDAHHANFTVIHCGACGACSNWNDLSLQWTTRSFLAEEAQNCIKQSLFSGTEEDIQACNQNDIGFSEECASCWTQDELCAKKYCAFIYLQSFIFNQVSNFNVELGDITTAACDEALCGPVFVPCSGATRRRMNIISDIPRPQDQQCNVAEGNWSEIFNHP